MSAQLALTDVPHGAVLHPAGHWQIKHVMGPWPALLREMRRALIEAAVTGWEPSPDGFAVFTTSQVDEVLIADVARERWARVRVTVEVLDGIP